MSERLHFQPNTDDVLAVVVTRFFNLEGYLHTPRLGKDGRRLSNLLNSSDRRFLAMTDVTVMNRATGKKDAKVYPFIEVNMDAVEFVQPYLNKDDEALEASQGNTPS